MIPSEFKDFFVAATGAGAALVGLLFVAIAVAPERFVMGGAPLERRAVASSSFTALLNAFFISFNALYSILLIRFPSDTSSVLTMTTLVMSIYGLGIIRAWELLGASRIGFFRWLNPLYDLNENHPPEASNKKPNT